MQGGYYTETDTVTERAKVRHSHCAGRVEQYDYGTKGKARCKT